MDNKKMRIALVNQRYGLEVNGGSEYYTRKLAEHLQEKYEIEILTTTALDYRTWENYYKPGVERIDGITVRRFQVQHIREPRKMSLYWRIAKFIPPLRKYGEKKWIEAQGPYAPELVYYIEEHRNEYDWIVFVTYLYYHTAFGAPAAAEKAVLLPTAHDEPYIHLRIFKKVFEKAAGLVYLTYEEKKMVESFFSVSNKPNCIAGTGIDLPLNINSLAYRQKFGVKGKYLIYVGRIDESKGCGEMFQIFRTYKTEYPDSELKLILMGKAMMDIPEDADIVYQGFVSEEDKFNGMNDAVALWLPSKFESLSLAVLEAMALGVPVIVNGQCEVLKGHCERSRAGFAYLNDAQAIEEIRELEMEKERSEMSLRAKKYIEENYSWSGVAEKLENLFLELQSNASGEEEKL